MELQQVSSGHIAAIGYDHSKRELFVQFKTGALYSHPDVPLEEAHAFMHADSKGKHFNERIKPNFPGNRVNLTEGKVS